MWEPFYFESNWITKYCYTEDDWKEIRQFYAEVPFKMDFDKINEFPGVPSKNNFPRFKMLWGRNPEYGRTLKEFFDEHGMTL